MKKYIFVDFDGTLINSPLPDTGKEIWLKHHNTEYPHIGWWSKKETLDTTVFDIKPIPTVHNIVIQELEQNNVVSLLTSRLKKLESEIVHILKQNNIYLHNHFFSNGITKPQVILDYLNTSNIDTDGITIDVYDDIDLQIDNYLKFQENFKLKNINFNIYKVDSNFIIEKVN